MLSMTQVNQEKAAKSRPDLIPGHVLRMIRFGTCYLTLEKVATFLCGPELPCYLDVLNAIDVICKEEAIANLGDFMLTVGKVQGYGFTKHGHCSWRIPDTEQADPRTHVASMVRHLAEYQQDVDEKEEGSGFPVLWHALAQGCITLDLMLNPPMKLEHAE